MDYHTFENIEPSGNVGYRLEVADYDDPEQKVYDTFPSEIYFFAQKPSPGTLNKQETYFTGYTFILSGINFQGKITLDGYQYERLLYVSFHIVDLGQHPETTQTVVSVRETPTVEFNNGVEIYFQQQLSNMDSTRYYHVFFNVYTEPDNQASVIYSSAQDFAETGYDPIVIPRITLDVTDATIDATKAFFRIASIHTKETDPERLYRVSVTATPIIYSV